MNKRSSQSNPKQAIFSLGRIPASSRASKMPYRLASRRIHRIPQLILGSSIVFRA